LRFVFGVSEVPNEEEGADTENQDNAGAIWRTRCNPGAWKPLIQGLSETMVQSISQSQFGRNMLKMQLTSLAYRQLCADLMRTAVYHKQENLIERHLYGGSLWINEKVIQHVLGVPRGSDKEPESSEDDVEKEDGAMWMLLHAGEKVQQQSPPQRSISCSNKGSNSKRRRAPLSYIKPKEQCSP
jgi:hypothetical protein